MQKKLLSIMAGCLMVFSASAHAAKIADVVIIVDESGSMSTEHAWLPGMVNSLNTALSGAGYTGVFGLFGFGKSGAGVGGRTLLNAGTAAQFGTAAANLLTTGGTEDGYAGINFASTNYNFTTGSVRNYILVTDEDRDILSGSTNTYASILALLTGQKALLNAVINNPFGCTGGGTGSVIGRNTGSGFRADGSGGYNTCTAPTTGNGNGTTETDYAALALATNGAAWNLNVLRAGGNSAASFTEAFVDIKLQEIINTGEVPEPGTYAMIGMGLAGLAYFRRKK
jgi:hypothetical protein